MFINIKNVNINVNKINILYMLLLTHYVQK